MNEGLFAANQASFSTFAIDPAPDQRLGRLPSHSDAVKVAMDFSPWILLNPVFPEGPGLILSSVPSVYSVCSVVSKFPIH
jgi:hypothetical protein